MGNERPCSVFCGLISYDFETVMTEKQIRDALFDLRLLWADCEFWARYLPPIEAAEIRETLKAAINAMETLRDTK